MSQKAVIWLKMRGNNEMVDMGYALFTCDTKKYEIWTMSCSAPTYLNVSEEQFGRMGQSDGESITSFLARLKSHAALCQFTVQCRTCDPMPPMWLCVSQQMVAGPPSQNIG